MRLSTTALLASLGLVACSADRSPDREAPATRSLSSESVRVSQADSAPAVSLPPSSDRRAWHEIAPWSADCEDAFQSARREGSGIQIFPLGPKLYLVEVQCDLAAYQAVFNYVLRDERIDPPRNTLLRFPEYDGGEWSMQLGVAGDPSFNPDRKELQVWSRARGLGDCGQLARYGFPNGELTLLWVRVRACDDAESPPDSAFDPSSWPLIPLDSVPRFPGQPGG